MALSKGDDYPIHQTPEPVAYAGTDRNFYDRYFFNGYSTQQDNTSFFAAAFGVYPHLNIADAAFVVVRNGVETALHASRCLNMERMDIAAVRSASRWSSRLQKLRVIVDAPDRGIAADIVFTGRSAPIEEPRFIRRIGPRTVMDYTRLTQNGRYQGWIELDGVRETDRRFRRNARPFLGRAARRRARPAGAGAEGHRRSSSGCGRRPTSSPPACSFTPTTMRQACPGIAAPSGQSTESPRARSRTRALP